MALKVFFLTIGLTCQHGLQSYLAHRGKIIYGVSFKWFFIIIFCFRFISNKFQKKLVKKKSRCDFKIYLTPLCMWWSQYTVSAVKNSKMRSVESKFFLSSCIHLRQRERKDLYKTFFKRHKNCPLILRVGCWMVLKRYS